MNSRPAVIILFVLAVLFRYGTYAQTTGSFVFDGVIRTYTMYVPATWNQGDVVPLVMALHGVTQTGNEMMQFTGFNGVAEENRFIVVYPDGVSNSWNVGLPGGSTADDVGFLSALIDTMHQQYSIDLERVYSTGFSNGGFMSYRLACELGGRIAAIGPVSGTMTNGAYSGCQPQRKVPVVHIHGTSDFVVLYNGGFGNRSVDEVLSFWRTGNLCPDTAVVVNLPDLVQEGSTVQTHSWSPCGDQTEVLLYKVLNGGHAWPGSVGTTGAGNTNRDISASEEIWKFVSRFSIDLHVGMSQESGSGGIKIFPNPADGFVIVSTAQRKEPGTLEIINSLGRCAGIYIIYGGSGQTTIDISSLSPGLYVMRVKYPSVEYTVRMMVN